MQKSLDRHYVLTPEKPLSESRERVLNVAEKLFSERGYAAVTLRDIADALGIRQASLYHHVPGGKEALFIEVMERAMRKHQAGLDTTIREAGVEMQAQLQSASRWLLSQPVMDFGRMLQSDMTAIPEEDARRLSFILYECLIMPIARIFLQAEAQNKLRVERSIMLAATVLTIIESVHNLPPYFLMESKDVVADMLIDVIMYGVMKPDAPLSESGLS